MAIMSLRRLAASAVCVTCLATSAPELVVFAQSDAASDAAGSAAPDGPPPDGAGGPGGPGGPGGHQPPEEAYTACESLSEGDTCKVTFNDHAIDGTCAADTSQDDRLFCRPKHHAPQAAIDACTGKSAGAACEVSLPSRDGDSANAKTLSGTCETDPRADDDTLSCRPTRKK
jgi:hypothetical protein